MCGRYASSRQPEDLVEEFEIRTADCRALEPDYNVAPTKEVYAVVERPPREDERGRRPSGSCGRDLGAGAVLGQGPLDRQPDDQRPDGDRRREAGLPPGLRAAARLLPADGYYEWYPTEELTKAGKPRKQPYFIRPTGRRGAGDGRPLRDLARPRQGRGRPRPVPLDVHGAHHHGRGLPRPHPRPDAADARRPSATPPGWTRDPRRATTCSTCWSRPRPAGSRPSRSPRWSPTSATTVPSWSSRSRWRSCRTSTPTGRADAGRAAVPTPHGDARLVVRRARRPVATLVLTHGAGGGIDAPDLVALAATLPQQGHLGDAGRAAVAGRRQEGRPGAAGDRRVLPRGAGRMRVRTPLVLGGRSAGARSACRIARGVGAARRAWRWPSRCTRPAGRRSRGSPSCRARGADAGGAGRARPVRHARGVPRRTSTWPSCPRRPRLKVPKSAPADPGGGARRSWSRRSSSGSCVRSSGIEPAEPVLCQSTAPDARQKGRRP